MRRLQAAIESSSAIFRPGSASSALPLSPNPESNGPTLRRAQTDPSRGRAAQQANGFVPLGAVDELADDAAELPFADARSPRSVVSPTARARANDDLLIELMASQALLELRSEPADMLEPDMFDALKRQHAVSLARVQTLDAQVQLEGKLRAASALVDRTNRTADTHPTDSGAVDALMAKLDDERRREIEINATLLRHSTAVLAAALRSRDAVAPSPTADTFDGSHLFAGNAESTLAFAEPDRALSTSPVPATPPAHLSQARFDELRAELETLRSRHADELRMRTDAMDTQADQLRLRTEELRERTAELDRLRSESSRQAESSVSASAAELARLRTMHASELERAHATRTGDLERQRAAHDGELDRVRAAHDDELEQLRDEHGDALARLRSEHAEALRRSESDRSAAVTRDHQLKLDDLELSHRRQLEAAQRDSQSTSDALAQIWAALPTSEALAAASRGDVRKYRAALVEADAGGRSTSNDSSRDPLQLVAAVRSLVASDRSRVDLLLQAQADLEQANGTATTAQRSLGDAQRQSASLREQIQALERRIAETSAQDAQARDRLVQLEANVAQLTTDKRQLEAEAARGGDAVERADKAEAEVSDLQQQLNDAQDDLDEFRGREQKQRVALLDELNSAQQEIASLRVQLRQEQRKNVRAGAPSPAPSLPLK